MPLQQTIDSSINAIAQNIKVSKGIQELATQNQVQNTNLDAKLSVSDAALNAASAATEAETNYNNVKQERLNKLDTTNSEIDKMKADAAHKRGRRSNAWYDQMNSLNSSKNEYSNPSDTEKKLQKNMINSQNTAAAAMQEYQRLSTVSLEKATMATRIAKEAVEARLAVYTERINKKAGVHNA